MGSDIYSTRRGLTVAPRISAPAPAHPVARRNYPLSSAPSRLMGDLFSADQSAYQTLFQNLRMARNRARQLARENDLAKRFLTMMCAKVVGSEPVGYQAKARDMDTRKLDRPANMILERAMREFSRRGVFTVCGSMSRVMAEHLVLRGLLVDGEVIVRKRRGYNNGFGFALQFLDPSTLDESYNEVASDGRNAIKLGIEVDADNRKVAFYFREEHDVPMGISYGGKRVRVPADEIAHFYITERIGQLRGVTWLATSGARMKMLDGYETAAVVGARVSAAKMGFLVAKTAEYEPEIDPATGQPVSGMLTMNADPGTIEQIPDGLEFQSWDPGQPPATLAEFVMAMKQGIASGLCMSYPTLASDLKGVSYSSIRKGDLDDRDFWRMMQSILIDGFHEQWIDDFLMMGMTMGAIPLPVGKLAKFREREWWPRTWEGVDPAKTIEHAKGLRALGVSNTTILRDLGYDIEEEAEQIETEPQTALLDQMGTVGAAPSAVQLDAADAAAAGQT